VLPAVPTWTRDYAATVRRLMCDGVEVPQARLFVEAAREVPPDTEGVVRARSATDALFFRRVQTLPRRGAASR
jgi:hypothetical protein